MGMGRGRGIDNRMTASFMKALAKEQLVPITWMLTGPNSQLVG